MNNGRSVPEIHRMCVDELMEVLEAKGDILQIPISDFASPATTLVSFEQILQKRNGNIVFK